MSNQEINQLDPVDALLNSAFEEALSEPANPALVDQVMSGIARRQRQRTLVLTVVGLIAAAIGALSAVPLLDSLQTLFSGFSVATVETPLSLPATLVAAAILIAGGWLLLEEATT